MALTQISTAGVKDDAVTAGKIPADAVGSSELADNAVDTAAIVNVAVTSGKISDSAITNSKVSSSAAISGTKLADNSIPLAKLPNGDSNNNGKFLRANNGATPSFETIDLTALSASNLTSGTVPDARFPATLPAASAANLTSIPAANLTGALPAISGANLTGITAKVVQCVTSYYGNQHSTSSSTLQNTGHTLVITPTSNSNKIIIMNQTNGGNNQSGRSWKHMLTYSIGGSVANGRYMQLGDDGDNSSFAFSHVLFWFHSSPGTNEITYQTKHATDGSGTAYYGYSGSYMVAWEVTP